MVMLLAASWATRSGPSCERAMDLIGGIGLPVPLFEDYAREWNVKIAFVLLIMVFLVVATRSVIRDALLSTNLILVPHGS